MSIENIVRPIEGSEARLVGLRFTDIKGKQCYFTVPARIVLDGPREWFENGQVFDSSSINGWKGIQVSDMQLCPDPATASIDPFYDGTAVVLTCDVIDPVDSQGYDHDPHSIARRVEAYLKSSDIGDTTYFGSEPELFVFDSVGFETDMYKTRHETTSESGARVSDPHVNDQNTGHRPVIEGGRISVIPIDAGQDLRSIMVNILEELDVEVEVYHAEVDTGNQMEAGAHFVTLVKRADQIQDMKCVIQSAAHNFGKTATFTPKPIMGSDGSGTHVHQSIWKSGRNPFVGDGYAGLGDAALHYVGGIIKYVKTLNAVINPSINSYKRLVPHSEVLTKLVYSVKNHSASIRIPSMNSDKARRIEARFPDPTTSPCLAFAALLVAGLDGIQNRIHPGDPANKNLYDLSPEEDALVLTVCASLEGAPVVLRAGHEFPLHGDVSSKDWIDNRIVSEEEDVCRTRMALRPLKSEMYYSL